MTRKSLPLGRIFPWRWNWRWRFTDNQWRKAMWERSAPVIVAIAVLAALAGGGWGVIQSQSSAHSSALAAQYGKVAANYGSENHTLIQRIKLINDRHHTQSVQQNKDIEFALAVIAQYAKTIEQAQEDHTATLEEIAMLETEVSEVIKQLPAADAALEKFAATVLQQLQALQTCVQQQGLNCSSMVSSTPSS